MRVGVALLLALLAGAASARSGGLSLSPCHPEGVKQELRCGTLMVPENREHPQGRKLALEVVVVPARRQPAKEPIFFLSGGPGQAATEQARDFALQPLTEDNDIVLVNFRGTGAATRLDCPQGGTDEHPYNYMEPLFREGTAYAACATVLSKKADLAQYTTNAAMDDLEDARKALAYNKIDLFGGSYGTRAAMVYIKRHGDHVRAAVLSGIDPFEDRGPLNHAWAAQRAFNILARQCAADAACHRAFPDPQGDLNAILARLKGHPAPVTLKHPKTGKPLKLRLTDAAFGDGLRVMLYDENFTRRVPLLLHRARRGDYQPFADVAMEHGRGLKQDIAMGLLLSVSCSEDVNRIRPEEVAKATVGRFIGDYRVRGQMAACSVWPRAEVGAEDLAPYRSDAPVLLISGNLDPVTPSPWGEVALKYFPNGKHIVVPGAHVSGSPCLNAIMQQFLKTASVKELNTACIGSSHLPSFVLN
ncbi:MAG: alpha/beta hydrolase [Alphaproteobacteria bacterium]|nr:alpha/beta hydrolase [Alphaproteobacteria bacterium]